LSDISDFLQSYNETLQQEIAGADMPPELTERFSFDSCVKQQDGRTVYFITEKLDGQRISEEQPAVGENRADNSGIDDHPAPRRAVLRVTEPDCNENAAAEGVETILKWERVSWDFSHLHG